MASCDIEHCKSFSRFLSFVSIIFYYFCADLLEKSRVIRQAPGERCYHIFYQIFSGQVPSLIKDLLLDKPVKDYYFIAQAELTIDGIDDKEEVRLFKCVYKFLLQYTVGYSWRVEVEIRSRQHLKSCPILAESCGEWGSIWLGEVDCCRQKI